MPEPVRKPPLVLAVEEVPDFFDKPDEDLGLVGAGVFFVAGGGVLGWVVVGGGVEDLGSNPGKPALRDGPTGPLGCVGAEGARSLGCGDGKGIEKPPPALL